jgi:hypothetical protein
VSTETWTDRLRLECARTSQSKVAERIGYSPAVVNQVLGGSYKGDLRAVQKAVEGALMGATVECPVLGTIGGNRCLEEQRRPFAATNPNRVRLFKTCPTCPNNRAGAAPAGEIS